ncbi:hypothetical protein AD13_1057 [Escherichia coli 3-020-07_S4_C2]|nr:hypothetical protein AD13_1057 [Escherichia coli 3-020-07_S4_C2]KDZ55400.1 hypothetical protein AD41_0593 [Escherichia coli 3-020-07_S4_C3]
MQCPDSRFIPAGAGNTKPPARPPITTPVYPRWRGEHDVEDSEIYWDNGLSPLARGTRSAPVLYVGEVRFIPAGAGNTKIWAVDLEAKTVYPRWRGEHHTLI